MRIDGIHDRVAGDLALIPAVITAGAGNDGVEVNGPAINRLSRSTRASSGCVMIAWETTLAQAATLTLTANMQDDTASAFNVAAADLSGVLAATVVATGPTGGGTIGGVTKFKFNLSAARQYVRLQCTANLSAAGTDTVRIAAVMVSGDGDQLPPA